MIDTSTQYKELVYSRDYARHFVPRVLIKIIDTNARTLCNYTSASSSFVTDFSQLINDVFTVSRSYGTLEDGQFNLGGGKYLMPDDQSLFGEVGYMSEEMSDANGHFATALEALICTYGTQVSTVGRTLYFDDTQDFVPKNFDLVYYRVGVEIARSQVRNNSLYLYTDTLGVQRYDKMILLIYDTTLPYRRPRIVEDIPGVYLQYGKDNVVSMTFTQSVDIFNKEIVAGELDLNIENTSKILDILNPDGFEKYLQRRQPIEVYIDMVFPDNTTESIPIGKLLLVDWKSNKGALAATFTARDAMDNLTLDEYIKGTLPATPISFYELAEAVLVDAGITDYEIDIELLNIYTNACLPIASHKELLRLIAQASQSIVLPTVAGGIHLKYFSPLLIAYNDVKNACFNTDLTDWTATNVTADTAHVYSGKQSMTITSVGTLGQQIAFKGGHKYYIKAYVWYTGTLLAGTSGIYVDSTLISVNLAQANLVPETWSEIAAEYTPVVDITAALSVKNNGSEAFNVGAVESVDLTLLYGAGNEPDVDWCNQNIRFFTSSASVPRVLDPVPVDTFDYSILIDAPEIGTLPATKSVETNIYTYTKDAATSEVYKGTRYITGTEEFVIKFSGIASDCAVTVASLDDNGNPTTPNTATLVSAAVYAQAAKLKVIANSNVQITVTGYKVSAETSSYKIDSDIDANLVADATAVTIDNKLITLRTVAEDITAYALYWYKRRYQYDFDWRQNPAIENTDWVKVYDDFGKNNVIMLVERNIDYFDGVLGGNSRGVF
jgi:hypothetical protein